MTLKHGTYMRYFVRSIVWRSLVQKKRFGVVRRERVLGYFVGGGMIPFLSLDELGENE